MGNLGFLFIIKSKQMIVFTKSNKFEGNIILGFKTSLNIANCEFKFLSKNLNFENFLILEEFTYKYSKIKVFNQKIFDFEDFIFWFKPKTYKELKFLFQIENFNEKILLKNVLDIYEYFHDLKN